MLCRAPRWPGDDHAGIVDLPDDAPVGVPYAPVGGLDDPVIDVSVTPNRGDCFSVRGIARDLAAARHWDVENRGKPAKISPAFAAGPRWRIEWPDACPWVLGRTIRKPSQWAESGVAAGRLTSNRPAPYQYVVDITNFFTVDLGARCTFRT